MKVMKNSNDDVNDDDGGGGSSDGGKLVGSVGNGTHRRRQLLQ